MARLLIVSRSMALAIRLADQHQVIEHPADELDTLLSNLDADVLVLDLGDPILAVNTVNSLREAEQVIPVLLVSGYQAEWEQVEAQQVDGVHVVPLPITRLALLSGISALIGEEPTTSGTGEPTAAQIPATAPTPLLAAATAQDDPAPAEPTPGNSPQTVAQKTDSAAIPPKTLTQNQKPADVPSKPSPRPEVSRPSAPPQPAIALAPGIPFSNPEALKPPVSPEPPEPPEPPKAPASSAASGPAKSADQKSSQPRPSAPTGDVPAVTRSDVTGLSYSTSLTRPFDQEPRTGQFTLGRPAVPPLAAPPQAAPPQAAPPLAAPPPATPPLADPPRWAPLARAADAPGDPSVPDEPPVPPSTFGNAMARRVQRLGNRPRKLQRRPGPDATYPQPPTGGLVTDPLGPRTDPFGFPGSDLDRRLDAEAAALVTRAGTAENGFGVATGELVRLLRERAGELYSVDDTAQALADDVIERADADAAAVLIPDGSTWQVSAGVGLRPLELRLELTEAHWLIIEIGSAGRAVLIEDTDIVRQQLSGAPLAAWRHLMAVPVPDIRGIVVLARGEEGGPFSDRDLSAVIAPVREAAGLLAQAVETRRLARLLAPLV
jgi:CheY-like chemotaxis protein